MSVGERFEKLQSSARAGFVHTPHPHIAARKLAGPVKVADQHPRGNPVVRFNTRLALATTKTVGSMWCAYAFAAFDCLALPQAIHGGLFGIVQWVASFFLQLVLLSIILVGQNVQGAASDRRAESTFLDAEAIIQAAAQIAEHLSLQDAHLRDQDTAVTGLLAQVQQILDRLTPPTGGTR